MKLKAVRRWAPWLALVVVFSLATTLLSWWQFDRREDRVAQIEMVNANYDIPPVPLSQLPWDSEFGQPVNEWRKVVIEGNYLPEQSVIVRNRPLRGQPGFLQLVPFRLNNGEILVVERGWLSAGEPVTVPQSNPMPNTLPRELIVRLRLSEQDLNRGDVPGQLAIAGFGGLTRGTTSVTKATTAYKQHQDVVIVEAQIADIQEEVEAIRKALEKDVEEIGRTFDPFTLPLEKETLKPTRTDVKVERVGLLWM